MTTEPTKKLAEFVAEKGFHGKGPLCVALVVTQHARSMGLPLDPEKLITKGGGQVLELGKGAVQAVLTRHHIDRVLASEGGRTSRGSLNNMRAYAAWLNEFAKQGAAVDLDAIEKFWIDRVHAFFSAKPFKIRLDASRSLRTVVSDILQQAEERQKTMPGVYYAGAVMQHIVGAKLDCVLSEKREHNSFSTADAPANRAGDFLVGDVAIHVTTAPGEALIQKCRENLDEALRPLIVTGKKGLPVAEGLASNSDLDERIDVFEIEQFVAANLYELGKFAAAGRRVAVNDLVERYNEIVEEVETDPSLKIELKR
jgi:Domain of unknown function (DUF4928)